jgi:hypothetical protein
MGWTLYFHGKDNVFEGVELQYTNHVDVTSDLL